MKSQGSAVCLRNGGFRAAIEAGKVYPALNDPEAEADNLIRVIDESGEACLYPASLFRKLDLPGELQRVLRLAS